MATLRLAMATTAVLILLQVTAHAADTAIPEAAQKGLERLIGKWKVESQLDGDTSRWEIECAWAPGKDALVYHWKGQDILTKQEATGTGFLGWDGAQKVVVEEGVASDGTVFSATHEISSDQWRSPTKGTWLIDDKYKQSRSRRRFTWNGDNELKIVSAKRTLDGEAQPDIVATFRRVR